MRRFDSDPRLQISCRSLGYARDFGTRLEFSACPEQVKQSELVERAA
jgi:hypothetical protein